MSQTLDILAPELVAQLDETGACPPALLELLARADIERCERRPDLEHALALLGLVSHGGSAPPAAASAAADLGDAAADVLRADPVSLRADVARVVLFDAVTAELGEAEADRLLALLNDAFRADGLALRRGRDPCRWYLEGAARPAGPTFSPAALNGQVLEPDIAGMRGLGELKRVMTEAQMLLHDCAVNAERAAAGRPPINSIWIWGTATLEPAATARAPGVCSDDPDVVARALAAGI
ncbi:MAG: hypothetical protein ACU85V_08000, partial [Gammaproteobacteria bacterium]